MNNTTIKYPLFFGVLLVLLVACRPDSRSMQQRGPTRRVITGSQRIAYTFGESATWDLFTVADDLAHFRLNQHALEGYVVADRGYVMSTDHVDHNDVIIHASVRQTDGLLGNGFGVVCRADAAGNGYYFLLASSGEFTISVGTAARNDLFELIPWQFHSVINQAYRENSLRAVCVENYLALFINDVFVAETFDDEFTAGALGVVIGAVDQPATARFDDILIQDARIIGSR